MKIKMNRKLFTSVTLIFAALCILVVGVGGGVVQAAGSPGSPTPTAQNGTSPAQQKCNKINLADPCVKKYNAALDACNTDDVNKPCVHGYVAAIDGTNKSTACTNHYQSQANQQACSGGFDAATTALNGGSGGSGSGNGSGSGSNNGSGGNVESPSCESNGFPLNLAWALCPIFNGVADVSDWLFEQIVQPLLRTTPISTDPASPSYQAWSNFRIYGNLFLVIALLVVVFGQSIGGGIVDAYTAKKVLPRLLIAVVLINLSIYIVAVLVDLTNIIGGSIGAVMTAPLKDAGAFVIKPSGIQTGALVGGTAAAGGIAAFLTGAFFVVSPALAVGFFGHASLFIALFVLMPVVLGLLAAFVTLVIRQGLILGLVLVSPFAFALYCLPNTEQYFRRWWKLLIQTLLVYPIVIIFFAVSDILSVTVMNSGYNGNVAIGPLALVISFVLQFLPLLFIPYAFRLAGGLIGQVHEGLTNYSKRGQEAVKGNANDPNSLRNRVKRNVAGDFTRARAQQYRTLKNAGDQGSFRRRVGGRLASGSSIIGDPLAKEASLIGEGKQRIAAIKDNGDDSTVNARASFIDEHGVRRTLDGKEVNEADYRTAMRSYPLLSDMQAVAEYRAGKVNTTEEAIEFGNNFARMAQQNGLSLQEAQGMMTGVGFGKQAERGEMKYGAITAGPDGSYRFEPVGGAASFAGEVDPATGERTTVESSRAANFIKEQYARRGSFEGSRMLGSYFQSMGDIKQHHIGQLEGLEQAAQTRQLTQEELGMQQHSRDQLKQILEIQKAFEFGGQVPDPNNPGQMIPRGGLSGASAETQAAFDRMKRLDDAGPPPNPGGNAPQRPIVQALNAEIDAGDTYEHQVAPDHGDFTGRPGP